MNAFILWLRIRDYSYPCRKAPFLRVDFINVEERPCEWLQKEWRQMKTVRKSTSVFVWTSISFKKQNHFQHLYQSFKPRVIEHIWKEIKGICLMAETDTVFEEPVIGYKS